MQRAVITAFAATLMFVHRWPLTAATMASTTAAHPFATAAPAVCPKPLLTSADKCDVESIQGDRDHMEDTYVRFPLQTRQGAVEVYAVFDGHGGHRCSDFLKENAQSVLTRVVQQKPDATLQEHLRLGVMELSEAWGSAARQPRAPTRRDNGLRPLNDGSTAVLVALSRDRKKYVTANTGDSRAVVIRRRPPPTKAGATVTDDPLEDINTYKRGTFLSGPAVPRPGAKPNPRLKVHSLTQDHKPGTPEELKRIRALAGGEQQLWGGRVCGLALSRAIGDLFAHPYVIPDPDVVEYDVLPEDLCLVVASDGVWDGFRDYYALADFFDQYLQRNGSLDGVAKELAHATAPHSGDNVTVYIIDPHAAAEPESSASPPILRAKL